MPYIGKQPVIGEFVELDALTASATADYALTRNSVAYYPETVNNLLVSINGVIQAGSTMSLSGNTLTVGATLSSSDVIDFVRVFGNVGNVVTPTDGSVTEAKIGSGAVTSAKLDTNIAISGNLDVGSIRASNGTAAMTIDSSGRVLQPAKPAFRGSIGIVGSTDYTTETDITGYTESFDIGDNFNPTTGIFTVPSDGLYQINFSISAGSAQSTTNLYARLYIDGTRLFKSRHDPQGGASATLNYSSVLNLTSGNELKVSFQSDTDNTVTIDGIDFSGYLVG